VLFAVSQINLRALINFKYILNEIAALAINTDDANDDIIGVHMNLFLGLPDSWLDLTGIIASVNVGEAITSAANLNIGCNC
jgi:hypothetical protein